MNLQYSDIRSFIEIAKMGNISRASERLGVTQPSLSQAVKRLEESLGVSLLVRGRTGVTLTKSGKEFQARSKGFLRSWDDLSGEIRKKATTVSGRFNIGCHPSVALYSLPRLLPDLIFKNPELEFSFFHDLSRKVTEKVISHDLDFGIVINPIRHPDLVIHQLCKDTVSFWVKGTPSSTQNTNPEKGVLVCDPELLQSQKIMGDMRKKGIGFKRTITSGNLEVITELTRHGVGVGLLPKRVATRTFAKELKLLDPSLPSFVDTLSLIYRGDQPRTEALRTIVSEIRKAFES